jgi:hypothetical protein
METETSETHKGVAGKYRRIRRWVVSEAVLRVGTKKVERIITISVEEKNMVDRRWVWRGASCVESAGLCRRRVVGAGVLCMAEKKYWRKMFGAVEYLVKWGHLREATWNGMRKVENTNKIFVMAKNMVDRRWAAAKEAVWSGTEMVVRKNNSILRADNKVDRAQSAVIVCSGTEKVDQGSPKVAEVYGTQKVDTTKIRSVMGKA